jgi:hypothetical protein
MSRAWESTDVGRATRLSATEQPRPARRCSYLVVLRRHCQRRPWPTGVAEAPRGWRSAAPASGGAGAPTAGRGRRRICSARACINTPSRARRLQPLHGHNVQHYFDSAHTDTLRASCASWAPLVPLVHSTTVLHRFTLSKTKAIMLVCCC